MQFRIFTPVKYGRIQRILTVRPPDGSRLVPLAETYTMPDTSS